MFFYIQIHSSSLGVYYFIFSLTIVKVAYYSRKCDKKLSVYVSTDVVRYNYTYFIISGAWTVKT